MVKLGQHNRLTVAIHPLTALHLEQTCRTGIQLLTVRLAFLTCRRPLATAGSIGHGGFWGNNGDRLGQCDSRTMRLEE